MKIKKILHFDLYDIMWLADMFIFAANIAKLISYFISLIISGFCLSKLQG